MVRIEYDDDILPVIRKCTLNSDRASGLAILTRTNFKKLKSITEPICDIGFLLQFLGVLDEYSSAAMLLGFLSVEDMYRYIRQFGPESL